MYLQRYKFKNCRSAKSKPSSLLCHPSKYFTKQSVI